MKKFFSFKKKNGRNLNNIFSKYIPRDVLDGIIEGKYDPNEPHFKEGLINFLIIQLKEEPEEPIGKLRYLHKAVISTILENNGFIVGIISTVVLATFGFPIQDNKDAANLCEKAAEALLRTLGNEIKIIYGSEEGLYGNIGTSQYSNYGPLIRGFDNKISLLMNLEFGKLMKS